MEEETGVKHCLIIKNFKKLKKSLVKAIKANVQLGRYQIRKQHCGSLLSTMYD